MLRHLGKVFVLLAIIFSACDQLSGPLENEDTVAKTPLARVNDIYLFKEDIVDLTLNEMSKEDSLKIVSKYVDSWVKKQLQIARASKEIHFDEAVIERKILDYKYALMVHEFEKYYIDQHLDKDVSDEDITQYYNEKSENFILRQNIIRGLFAAIPLEAPQIELFRKQIRSYPNSDIEEIKSYCYRFASQSSLDTDLWINLDEILNNSPLAEVQDKVKFLKTNSYIEASDEVNYYFIRLLDYKISNQISPLEYIKDDIESILINKKKVDLRKQLEENLLKNAKENNEFEIY